MEKDIKTRDDGLGLARFILAGGEVEILLARLDGEEDVLSVTEEENQKANSTQNILRFENLSRAGEFDGYKMRVRMVASGDIDIFYVFRFSGTDVKAAGAAVKKTADFLETGLDQIRLF